MRIEQTQIYRKNTIQHLAEGAAVGIVFYFVVLAIGNLASPDDANGRKEFSGWLWSVPISLNSETAAYAINFSLQLLLCLTITGLSNLCVQTVRQNKTQNASASPKRRHSIYGTMLLDASADLSPNHTPSGA